MDRREEINHLQHPMLTEQETALLDSSLLEDELKKALSHLNKNKCPGTERICPEFYSKFWPLLSPYLLDSLSFSVEKGLLSTEQRRGGS